MKEILKKLSEAPSISGCEENVSKLIMSELKGKVDEIRQDCFGNVITRKGEGKPTVLIAAHMDEVGLMIKHIDDNGFLKFAKVGGLDDQVILTQRVLIHTKKGSIPGVLGSKPVHLLKEEEKKTPVKPEAMFIDAGFNSKKEAEKAGVAIGDWISFDRDFTELRDKVTGKAFDNRVGCAVLAEFMKRVKPKCEVYGVFTVQEEVGLRGAKVSAFGIAPDIGIAVDTDFTGDTPGITPEESNVKVGKGPVISIADGAKGSLGGGLLTNPKIVEWLASSAKKAKIKYQTCVTEGGTTDATAITLTRSGVPTGSIGIPTRYLHTPVQVLSLKDARNTIKLLDSALKNLPKI